MGSRIILMCTCQLRDKPAWNAAAQQVIQVRAAKGELLPTQAPQASDRRSLYILRPVISAVLAPLPAHAHALVSTAVTTQHRIFSDNRLKSFSINPLRQGLRKFNQQPNNCHSWNAFET